jgi:hypothetical protein
MYDIPRNFEPEFLAFVEDDCEMSQSERDVVRRMISCDPDLASLAAGMREDRGLLGSLRPVRAPASVLAGLEERLEHEALAALEQRSRTAGGMAQSNVVIPRPGLLLTMWETGTARRLAMAAGMAITVGIGVWGYLRVSSWQAGGGLPGLVSATGHHDGFMDENAGNQPDGPLAAPALAVEAPMDGSESGLSAGDLSRPPAIASALPGVDDAGIEPAATSITAERAVELAQSGRLVIRVRAVDADAAAREIHQVAQQSSKEVKWRPLEASQAPEILRALATKPEVVAGSPERDTGPDPSRWSSPKPEFIPPWQPRHTASAAEFVRLHPEMRALYTVEVPQRPQELASLLSALSPARTQVAEFVELEEAIKPAPSLEPGAVLWWGRAPTNWIKRASVPIVVEPVKK